ncbi:MAG: hypothetical protein JXA13_15025 [Anaerolineales bacterium]|nr:hypothetical protein [Anaerolineales bacterium]
MPDIPLNLTNLVLVAFFVEALIQTVKPIYDKEKGWNFDVVLALIVGIFVCLLTGTDIFKLVGLEVTIPLVGTILTGIMASRGSNVVHDIFKWLRETSTSVGNSGPVG